MFKRKMYDELLMWKKRKKKKAFLLKGARQTGKTTLVKEFAKNNYKNVIYIDFRSNANLMECFDGDFNVDDIMMQLSSRLNNITLLPYETVIIFDEIQDCPNARSSLKYFCLDGRYDVICTGSLLGIKGFNKKVGRGIPVGFEEHHTMKPLDFEEFLWANGTNNDVIEHLKLCFREKKKVLPLIHDKMLELFYQYICVGGMPEVVNAFLENKDMNLVLSLQRNILDSYQEDFGTHLDEEQNLYVNKKELARILACYKSIPSQLSKENKKFQFSLIKDNGRREDYRDAIEWLEDAGIVSLCNNLSIPELPLEGNKMDDIFKVYMQDTGLFVSMLEQGTAASILKGNLLIYKGAIFENIVADAFSESKFSFSLIASSITAMMATSGSS